MKMHRTATLLGMVLGFAGLLAATTARAATVRDLTTDDYYGYGYFQNALEYDEVAKLESRARQIRVVARDMGWKPAQLAAAIEKVESVGEAPLDAAKDAIQSEFEKSRVKGRVFDLSLDDSSPKLVVAYVRLKGTTSRDVIKDASAVAHAVHESAPFVSTVSMCIIHPKWPETTDKCVWSAKIGHEPMARIQPNRIETYADRLYKNMFEVESDMGMF
jgi:hypothetical protein